MVIKIKVAINKKSGAKITNPIKAAAISKIRLGFIFDAFSLG
jgi:hypothetical protein